MPDSRDEIHKASERLLADRRAMDEFNQAVIKEFRASGGKVAGQMKGMPVLLLTTTGAKSGRALTRPLVYTRDGERIVIVASYGGNDHNPPWYHNLLANPRATVEIDSDKFTAEASVTSGDERRTLFERHAQRMPIFADYQEKTRRQIPVLVLKRVA
ncbi:MAG: nitroreductase family deazaflavin-dependent oxidoreductase [Candidatus Binataceae bacterium]